MKLSIADCRLPIDNPPLDKVRDNQMPNARQSFPLS